MCTASHSRTCSLGAEFNLAANYLARPWFSGGEKEKEKNLGAGPRSLLYIRMETQRVNCLAVVTGQKETAPPILPLLAELGRSTCVSSFDPVGSPMRTTQIYRCLSKNLRTR